MARRKQPIEIWVETRRRVWERDGRRCQSPLQPPLCQGKPFIALDDCHIDHIQSGRQAGNQMENLRVLCPACHALRADARHRGMIAEELARGELPANWRELVWEG